MIEPERIDPKQNLPDPIRNESLPPRRVEHIKAVFDVLGRRMENMMLEQFEFRFMRDMAPETELSFWCNVTAAWIMYDERFRKTVEADEKELVAALNAICSGV